MIPGVGSWHAGWFVSQTEDRRLNVLVGRLEFVTHAAGLSDRVMGKKKEETVA